MNNIQIIKKRLKDIKQLSEDLKNSSHAEEERDENVNIIRMIMEMTKSMGDRIGQGEGRGEEDRDGEERRGKKEGALLREIKNKGVKVTLSAQQKLKQLQKQYQEKLASQSQQLQHLQTNLQTLTSTIQTLRTQNTNLTQTLQHQSQQLLQLPTPSPIPIPSPQQQSQTRAKHLAGIQLTQLTNLYLTKINIDVGDYGKIEYQVGDVRLGLSFVEVRLFKKQRRAVGEDAGGMGGVMAGRISKKIVALDLSDLCKIGYLPNNTLLLTFLEDHQPRYLYIQFTNYEHLHRWDLGLFVNLTIIKNLGNERMFGDGAGDGLLGGEGQGEGLMASIKWAKGKSRRDEELEGKWVGEWKEAVGKGGLQGEDLEVVKEYFLAKQRVEKIEKMMRQSGLSKKTGIQTIRQSKYLRESVPAIKITQQKKQPSPKQLQQSRKREQQKQLQQQMKRKEQERRAAEQKKAQQQRLAAQALQKRKQALSTSKNILKKGMYMTKYSQSAFNPHYKKVFLSQEEKKLCWKDKDERNQNEYKWIPVTDIISVGHGEIGPGIEKHVGKKDRLESRCYVVIGLRSQKRKRLEFSIQEAKLMGEFCENMAVLVEALKEDMG